NMSEGMQAIAGNRLRKMIQIVTDNRVKACATGALVTSVIQSSSVTSVMVIGMVSAGLMTLTQAVGVVLGADIGTTITAWIVSINVIDYGLLILGCSGFFYLFAKKERIQFTAMTFMGIGMVFFGLCLMKNGLHPLRDQPEVLAWFSRFSPDSLSGRLKCVLVGALVTAVVQSSSATVAITITLARNDLIGFDTAVALVLGENIGTTITAYLASLGATTSARRVAYGHILTKVIGVTAMITVFPIYLGFLNRILSVDLDIAKKIAFAHTVFNVMLVVGFLPLVTPFVKLLTWLAPDKPEKEEPRLTFLDLRMLDTPAISIQQSSNEIARMGEEVLGMLNTLRQCVGQPDDLRDRPKEQEVFDKEKMLDVMQKEIMEFLGHLLTGTVPHDIMAEARQQLRIADEYESISDYIATILKLRLKRLNFNLPLTDEDKRDIWILHDQTTDYIRMVNQAVKQGNPDILPKAMSQGETITYTMKEARQSHIRRVEEKLTPPLACLIMVDMLQSYRRIKDHTLNIAETLAGEK
ncbi:MAG: Na/Pi cotransporter family protein, partial [Phycisphaerae bacterium]|nr:Na/Pi cotransporter family protein [Phycisphaerae bacterium]